MQTAKANGLQVFDYLTYVFDRLPLAATVEVIEALLPWNVTPAMLAEDQKQRMLLVQSAA